VFFTPTFSFDPPEAVAVTFVIVGEFIIVGDEMTFHTP
jgi:hypothetical protein